MTRMDLENTMLHERSQAPKSTGCAELFIWTVWGRQMHRETRWMVAGGCGEGAWGKPAGGEVWQQDHCWWMKHFFLAWQKCSKMDSGDVWVTLWLNKKNSELYTLDGWIIGYVNSISIKLFSSNVSSSDSEHIEWRPHCFLSFALWCNTVTCGEKLLQTP